MCIYIYWNRKQKNIEKHRNIEIIYNVENFLDVTYLRVNYSLVRNSKRFYHKKVWRSNSVLHLKHSTLSNI